MKRHTAEEIIPKLRQAESDLALGLSVAQVCQKLGVSEQTLHRWRNQYGGLKQDEAKRLKELEAENARLKRLVAELALDKQMLQEVAQKKWWPLRSDGRPCGCSRSASASPSAAPAGCWGSSVRRSGSHRGRPPRRKGGWWRGCWSW
jgi:putative transposase